MYFNVYGYTSTFFSPFYKLGLLPSLPGPEVMKKNFMLNSAEHDFFPAQLMLKCQQKIVGILTFYEREK